MDLLFSIKRHNLFAINQLLKYSQEKILKLVRTLDRRFNNDSLGGFLLT